MGKVRTVKRRAKIFIISDTQLVKDLAKGTFAEDLVGNRNNKKAPLHIHESTTKDRVQQQKDAMLHVVSDLHLFSMAHIHVISQKSGLGQKAAMLSVSRNKLMIGPASSKTHVFLGDWGVNCTPVSTSTLVSHWSGI